MTFIEFPKWLHHADHPSVLVANADAEAAQLALWGAPPAGAAAVVKAANAKPARVKKASATKRPARPRKEPSNKLTAPSSPPTSTAPTDDAAGTSGQQN